MLLSSNSRIHANILIYDRQNMSIKNVELMQVYFLLTYIVKQHDIKCLKIVYTIDKKCLKIFYIVTKKGASNLSDQMPPGVQVNCQLTYRQLTCYLWQ